LDFILVSIPILLLTLSVIGLALNGFVKNIAQDLAVDTARFAALADQDSSLANERAMSGLGLILPKSFVLEVLVRRLASSATCAYEAQITLKPISVGFLSGIAPIKESARAVCELQR
jgi:hypothetical protein